jgi:hypothetical protein
MSRLPVAAVKKSMATTKSAIFRRSRAKAPTHLMMETIAFDALESRTIVTRWIANNSFGILR